MRAPASAARASTDLRERLAKLARRNAARSRSKPPLHRPTTWVEPELVAEIEFAGWTPDRYLRAPVFLRLRDDLAAPRSARSEGGQRAATRRCDPPAPDDTARTIERVLEQLDNKSERVDLEVGARAHPADEPRSRVLAWPTRPRRAAITKRDLLRYLVRVSPYLLPHLADRPLTMIRMPEGIDGERFFQKHWTQERPEFVETINVWSGSKNERQEYLLANNLPTLLWLGQVGTLEFHVWHSRAAPAADAATDATDYSSSEQALEESILNYPDYLVFDIDPYIYSGKEPKGAEPELNKQRLRRRPPRCVLATRAARRDVARGRGQDLGQDGAARVRADRAHRDVRRGADDLRDW